MKYTPLLLAALALPLPALAAPEFSAEGFVEVQVDHAYSSDDPDAEVTNTFTHTEFAPTVALTEHLSVAANVVLEQTQDLDPGDDGFFENEGIFVEELFAAYDRGAWGVWAGKFNPAFGQAWSGDTGIWTEDFAEDYEITEKIGGGALWNFDGGQGGWGAHTLGASAFFADTSALSDSAITRRGQTRRADGGASNTGDLSSFALSLEGAEIAAAPGLYYGLYLRHLAQGEADTGPEYDDEQGWGATLGYVWAVTDALTLDMLGEVADIRNFDGGPEDRTYATAMGTARWDSPWGEGAWDVTLSYTARDVDYDAGGSDDDWLAQATAGYTFANGIYVKGGWRGAREGGVDTDSLGALVGYSFAF